MNPYFSFSDTLYHITSRWPETVDALVRLGFGQMANSSMRETMGKLVSFQTAVKSRGLEAAEAERLLVQAIEQARCSIRPLTIQGVLPCPIRMQILERLEQWFQSQPFAVNSQLQAASMGVDWIASQVAAAQGPEDLADVYLSAGFELFFDQELLGGYANSGIFSDQTGLSSLNACFSAADLKDPLGQYAVLGVVPAVFMVNQELLGDRPFPRTWQDLMKPEFHNTLSLPVRDLDLFHALLLAIYSRYGSQGVEALGRNLMTSMHPAQMVKAGSQKKTDLPVVSVMPYFFTLMTSQSSPLKAVWPEDGAAASPIFLLTKAASARQTEPLARFLASREMGRIFSGGGKFPAANPETDNGLSPDQTFLWPGWDFLRSHNIAALLKENEAAFLKASEVTA